MRDRTLAACSPMPPVKTRRRARERGRRAAIPAAARRTNISSASAARRRRGLGRRAARGCRPCRRDAEQARTVVEGVARARPEPTRPSRSRRNRMPGSIEPARVPIIRPSSGVMPIDVSTDRPPSTAVTEQPLPRWATTSRAPRRARPSSSAGPPTDHATDRPWKPYRRMPQSLVPRVGHRVAVAGSAAASRGRRCRRRRRAGRRAEPSRAARIVSTASGLWSGARSASSSSSRQRPRRRSAPAAVKRVPPWTTRWPTRSIGAGRLAVASRSSASATVGRRSVAVVASEPQSTAARQRRRAGRLDDARLERARARVQDEDAHRDRRLSAGQVQSRISGGSSPCSRA